MIMCRLLLLSGRIDEESSSPWFAMILSPDFQTLQCHFHQPLSEGVEDRGRASKEVEEARHLYARSLHLSKIWEDDPPRHCLASK